MNDQSSKPSSPSDQGGEKTLNRWPWITALVLALLVGGGVGFVAAGSVEPEIVTEEVEVEVEPADLVERREALDERESLLDDRNETLSSRSSDLDEREESLDDTETALEEREEAVTQQELDLEENTIPGSGTFIVGEDIEPGTYRTSGADFCLWERLSGFSGEYRHVIAEGYSDGIGYVTIAESDTAFLSEGCADWIRE